MTDNIEQIDENKNERVGFGTRLGAYMLDFLAILIIGTIVGLVVGNDLAPLFFSEQIEQFNEVSNQFDDINFDIIGMMYKMLAIAAGMSLITVVIFILEGALGQSVGKMLLKIENTNIDGTKADAGKLWLRSLLKYGSTLLSLLGGMIGLSFLGVLGSLWSIVIFIGFFLVFMDNRQTIHDMIAKTVVSRK